LKRKIVHIDEDKCDGCGICIPACAEGALRIIDGKARLVSERYCDGLGACLGHCPQGAITVEERESEPFSEPPAGRPEPGEAQWPVQIHLVPVSAPFLKHGDLLVTADCVPAVCPDFHRRFRPGRAILLGCPKFDDVAAYTRKLATMFQQAQPRSLTVLHMEVPCCSGLMYLVRQALTATGMEIPCQEFTICADGRVV